MSIFSEYRNMLDLLKKKHQVVFYSESRHYYPYFKQLIEDLKATQQVAITYITSDKQDPLLTQSVTGMQVVHIKWMLGFLFSKIKADVMIMTMPDLGNYLFRRSEYVGNYIYMFHAAVSTHQQYREHAFDNYDTVFCTGDYQVNEIRRTEELYKLGKKELVNYGYPLFDELNRSKKTEKEKTILLAPSWYPEGIFDSCFEELIKILSGLPYRTIIRTHPEYVKRNRGFLKKIKQEFGLKKNIQVDELTSVTERLSTTDILITDRSGIAFEFAFGIGRPVLFIDTPLKINNPASGLLGIEPKENTLRKELGISLEPTSLQQLPMKINELFSSSGEYNLKFSEMRQRLFFNSVESYRAGVDFILSKTCLD